jgi:hypothetical protein
LLSADDQVAVTTGAEDANYTGKKLEEKYEKWGLEINYGRKGIFKYRSFRRIAVRQVYNSNCISDQWF